MRDRIKTATQLSVWCAGTVLALGAIVHAAESLRIVPIVHGDQVLVSAEIAGGYADDVRDAISSGLRTTFTYDVELRIAARFWVDRTIATAEVSISDHYDNLTRRHSLMRTVDGRIEESLVTEDEAVVRQWLTTLNRLPLCKTSVLEPNQDYYVRISSRVLPHRTSLFGFTDALIGQAKFTFIP